MKKTIETVHQLEAPLAKVWDNVRTGEAWEKWLPILSGSTMEGQGKGAKRVCHTHDQGDLYETILESDDINHIFQYRIDEQNMMPISDITGSMKFIDDNGGTRLEWNVEFEVENEETFEMVRNGISDIYATSSQKLAEISK